MIDRLAPSGAEIFASRVAEELDPARFERVLCVTRPSPGSRRPLEEAGVRGCSSSGAARSSTSGAGGPWSPLLRRERVDVLHSHKFGSNVWAALIARRPRPGVRRSRTHLVVRGAAAAALLDRRLGRAAADVVLTRLAGRPPADDRGRGCPVRQGAFVPSGVRATPARPREATCTNSSWSRARRCRHRLRPAAAEGARRAACEPRRGSRAVPGVRVVIVGEGPERPRLEALIRELGVEATVILLGVRPPEDIADIIDAFDVAAPCRRTSRGRRWP